MNSLKIEKLEPPPSKFSLFFWNFVVSVLGLAALVYIPIYMQRDYDRLQREMNDQVEPAIRQANHSIERAYEARNYAYTAYFLLDATPFAPFRSRREYYNNKLSEWRKETAVDSHMDYCGNEALRSWHAGTSVIDKWLDSYGRQFVESGTGLDYDEMTSAEKLFTEGARSLRDAREMVFLRQNSVATAGQQINHKQTLLVI